MILRAFLDGLISLMCRFVTVVVSLWSHGEPQPHKIANCGDWSPRTVLSSAWTIVVGSSMRRVTGDSFPSLHVYGVWSTFDHFRRNWSTSARVGWGSIAPKALVVIAPAAQAN